MRTGDAYDSLRILLESVPEHRGARGLRHPIAEVLFIILVGVVCGQEDAEAIEDFALENEEWFRERCGLKHGIPSQDTYLRVLAAMNPESFEAAFRAWVDELWTQAEGRHIAIDGKTLRGSFDRAAGLSPVHSVAAYASELGLVLGSVTVEHKENEIVAIPKLLKLIDVEGATVTIDAMGCQTAIAQAIHEAGGYYMLHVKDNQPMLRGQVAAFFEDADRSRRPVDDPAPKIERVDETDKAHGRLESRRCEVSHDLGWLDVRDAWAGLTSIVRVTRRTEDVISGKSRADVDYFISNRPTLSAQQAQALVRGHWAIENSLHWVLDVTFDEDHSRIRTGYAAKNLATIRRAALNLISTAPSPRARKSKVSNARRRTIAALRPAYREAVLRLVPATSP